MKILQLIQKSQLRGAEIFACQLSNRLVDAHHEVLVISLLPGEAQLPFKGKHIRLDRPLSKRFIDINGWKQLAKYVREFNPDVVQANAGDTLKFAVFSKLIFGWKPPIIFRNANKVSDFINSTLKRVFNKFLVSKVSHVISVSELCRQDFVSTYNFSVKKITTVPIGLDISALESSLPNDLKYFFETGKVLVHVGSFVKEKNHAGLLRLIKQLVADGVDVKAVLVGDGKLRQEIVAQIAELKLTDRILLTGYRKEALSIMANAHAMVLPSLIEGLPGVILEAMYCKVPVIANNVGGISEVIKHKETGWLIKVGDEVGFIQAVKEVLSMRSEELSKITENAHQLVLSEYDNRVIAGRFLEVYEKVAGFRLPVSG